MKTAKQRAIFDFTSAFKQCCKHSAQALIKTLRLFIKYYDSLTKSSPLTQRSSLVPSQYITLNWNNLYNPRGPKKGLVGCIKIVEQLNRWVPAK